MLKIRVLNEFIYMKAMGNNVMSIIFRITVLMVSLLTSFIAMSSSEQPDFFVHKFMDLEIKKINPA